jgi:hypothetical protein
MDDTITAEQTPEDGPVVDTQPPQVDTLDADTPEPEDDATALEDEPAMFPAEYVKQLRKENAEARVRAKIADEANVHLLGAYAEADGRLIDPTALEMSDALLGADGLVDRDRVREAIDALLEAKSYLRSPRPTTPLALGAQPAPTPMPSLFAMMRGEVG